MSKLKPVHGNVILRPIEEEEQMAGNIILPDIGHDLPEVAEVIGISQTYNFNSDTYVPSEIKVGMKVLIPKMGAQSLIIEGEEYWITNQTSILSILEE